MKISQVTLLILASLILALSIQSLNSRTKLSAKYKTLSISPEAKFVPGKVIVKLNPQMEKGGTILSKQVDAFQSILSLKEKMEAFGIYEVKRVFPEEKGPGEPGIPDLSTIFELSFSENQDPLQVAESFLNDPNVLYAEPRFIRYFHFIPNDSLFSRQTHLASINAAAAWDITQGDSSVVIGIVDTGVEWSHPDLAANIWRNPGEIPENGIDDDNNGYVDDIRGWDFGDGDNDPNNRNISIDASHGTIVAGTACAVTNNSIGVAGIGFKSKIMPVKIISDTAENQRELRLGFEGIKYAAENGADIINASWGGPGRSNFEMEIIEFANAMGSLVVSSAGNNNDETLSYPAAYPHALSVAATDNNDTKAGFSSFGFWVDISAPGVGILSTTRNQNFAFASGTSFSTPLVSGVGALVKSQNPNWSPDEVGEQVRVSANNIDARNPLFVGKLGHGRLDAWNALTLVSPSVRVTEVNLKETTGDGDDILEPSETFQTTISVKNFLAPASNVSIQVETADPFVTLLDASASVATLARGQTVNNQNDPITFSVSANAPNGHKVDFLINIFANNGSYEDRDHFSATIAPLFSDHNVGNVILTVTSQGNLGFNDFPNNLEGSGFVFNHDGRNLLFEGALLVATSPTQVVDVARNSSEAGKDEDFVPVPGKTLAMDTPGELADQQTLAVFDDSGHPTPIGIEVTQESYSFANHPDDDYVLLKYTIKNKNGTGIENLRVGIFCDWDIDEENLQTNQVGFDQELSLGYIFTPNFPTYGGVKVLNGLGATSYRAISNEEDLFDDLRFTEAEKFQFLSEGFIRTTISTPGDQSHLIATGPFRINPGEEVVAGFAVLGGTGLEDLKSNARAAQKKWDEIIGEDLPGNLLPTSFVLHQNYPNPFNPTTNIIFEVPRTARITLKIYNVLGQEIITLLDEVTDRGIHPPLQWNGTDKNGKIVPAGIYFVQMRAEGFSQSRKMILL